MCDDFKTGEFCGFFAMSGSAFCCSKKIGFREKMPFGHGKDGLFFSGECFVSLPSIQQNILESRLVANLE